MSYINGVTGYRQGILANRSIIKKNNYALIEPDGIVKNAIVGFENCDVTILSSPKIGASFVDYLLTINEGGKNHLGFGGEGIEVFFYILEGNVKVWNDDKSEELTDCGYIFSPANKKLYFENIGDKPAKGFLYKRLYDKIDGYEAYTVIGNGNDLEEIEYEGMTDVIIKNFLPATDDFGFDMNFHILSFKPGASHGYVETHFPEHGAYIFSGQGMYNLDNEWVPVEKGDYIFMSAYSLQGAYGVGRGENFAYIYSKDCNRDAKL